MTDLMDIVLNCKKQETTASFHFNGYTIHIEVNYFKKGKYCGDMTFVFAIDKPCPQERIEKLKEAINNDLV